MFLSKWREFPSVPCLAEKKNPLMTARVSMLLKSRASLTCLRASFLLGRAKDLSAPTYVKHPSVYSLFSRIKGYCTKNKREHIILLRDMK